MKPLASNVENHLLELANIIAGHWYTDLLATFEEYGVESPVEQLFYAEWKFLEFDDTVDLRPQHPIGQYFADFLVDPFSFFINSTSHKTTQNLSEIDKKLPKVIVEIDGHWHEKNPEQVERDKQRERFIVSQGYKVFRFSGREVVRNIDQCVREVFEFIEPVRLAVAKEYREKGW